ncbi:MAG: hypothetical protein U0487_01130 [Patescibacteria group bacterium]
MSAFCSFVALIMLAFWPPDTPTARPHQSWIWRSFTEAAKRPYSTYCRWITVDVALCLGLGDRNLWSPALRESRWHMDGYWVWFAMQTDLMVGSVAYRSLPQYHAPLRHGHLVCRGGAMVMASLTRRNMVARDARGIADVAIVLSSRA